MNGSEPPKYIARIVLEILDRPRFWLHYCRTHRIDRFNIIQFKPKEAARVFLQQYNDEVLVRAQKINIWYHNQQIRLSVRDMIYRSTDQDSSRSLNSMIVFVYRIGMFSEIRWPTIVIDETVLSRIETNDKDFVAENVHETLNTNTNLPSIGVSVEYSSTDLDKIPSVICTRCFTLNCGALLSMKSTGGNGVTTSSVCRCCDISRSALDAPQLPVLNNRSVSSSPAVNDEVYFRSSIYVYINQIKNL